ncbi:MAG TPA: MFS transporter [Candidatus Eisenbacteria bacterium]|nr:MFS transporter [Candidatus Eisenbacteria bacterium]
MLSAPAPVSLLALAQFLSQFGDSVFQIAFLWLLLDLTGSKSVTGLAATVSYLPPLLFGLVAGVLVDRWDRRRVLIGADLARATLLGLLALLWGLRILTAPWLTAVAFGMATAAVLFNPSRDSLLPEIVSAGALTRANAWVQSSQQFAFLLGPLTASVIIDRATIGATFPAGIALFLGSMGLLFAMRVPPRVDAARASAELVGSRNLTGAFRQVFRELLAGLRELGRIPPLPFLYALTALDNLFIMGVSVLGLVVLVRETLGGTAADYALAEATYGVGMVAGSLAVVRWGNRWSSGALLLIGITLDGLTYLPLLACRSMATLVPALLVHSFAIPLITVPRATILQRLVPPRLVGRAFALLNVVVLGVTALSCGLAGMALERVSAPVLFALAGALGGATGLVGFLSLRLRSL